MNKGYVYEMNPSSSPIHLQQICSFVFFGVSWFPDQGCGSGGQVATGKYMTIHIPHRIHGTIAYFPTWMVDFYGK